jgi:hypothetical protein
MRVGGDTGGEELGRRFLLRMHPSFVNVEKFGGSGEYCFG